MEIDNTSAMQSNDTCDISCIVIATFVGIYGLLSLDIVCWAVLPILGSVPEQVINPDDVQWMQPAWRARLVRRGGVGGTLVVHSVLGIVAPPWSRATDWPASLDRATRAGCDKASPGCEKHNPCGTTRAGSTQQGCAKPGAQQCAGPGRTSRAGSFRPNQQGCGKPGVGPGSGVPRNFFFFSLDCSTD